MTQLTVYVQLFENQEDLSYLENLILSGVNSVKVEGSFSSLPRIHRMDKNVRIVARHIALLEEPLIAQFPYGEGDPIAAAKVHVEMLKTAAQPNAYTWWCSPYNEPGGLEDATKLTWYNHFEVERQQLYASHGFKAAIGAFSAEANLFDKIEPVLPAIRVAAKLGNLLDLHGYDSPTLLDHPQFLFPYRRVYDELKRRGEPVPAFFMGEFGYDRLFSVGTGSDGFRDGGLSNEVYAGQIVNAVETLGTHPADFFLVGAAVFLFSDAAVIQPSYNIKWGRVDARHDDPGVAYRLLDYMSAHKGDPIAIPVDSLPPTPIPVPVPQPDNGRRRVIRRSNIRGEPSINAVKYGELHPSPSGTYIAIDPEHVVNGYAKWAQTGWWVLAANLEKP